MQNQNYYYNPQYSRYTPQQPLVSQPMPMLRGRPVSGLEEVRAAAVDFDGIVTYFPDLAHGCIYTKQCNMDGTAALNVYEIKPLPTETNANPNNFVTREEFTKALAAIREAFNSAKIDPQTSNPTPSNNPEPVQKTEFNFN